MKRIALVVLCWIAAIGQSLAQDTTINYKGQPPPSAIAPSMSAFSQDVCAIPVAGSVSTTIFGVSGGTVLLDDNCVRIKLAKTLNDLGLKVAAVSVLCDDDKVWRAMEMSGSPCPIGGSIGDTARLAWFKMKPERFHQLYGKTWTPPAPAPSPN